MPASCSASTSATNNGFRDHRQEQSSSKAARRACHPAARLGPAGRATKGEQWMPSVNIVVPDDYPIAYGGPEHPQLSRLAPYGTVVVHTTRWADRAELFERIAPAEVVINVRAYSVFDDEALAHAPRLKMISILGTGTDNVDLEAATRRGVVVTNTPGIGAVP